MRNAVSCSFVLAVALLGGPARAHDRWEQSTVAAWANDDLAADTRNELRHGDLQIGHDLQAPGGTRDEDWSIVRALRYHSYEAIARSGTVAWTITPPCTCARFERMALDGTVLTVGIPDGPVHNAFFGTALRIPFYGTGATEYLRVLGPNVGIDVTAADQYDIALRNTTYLVPRFNNSGTQSTVLVVQNGGDAPVHVDAQFFDAAGVLLAVHATDIPARGLWVTPTASVAALQGKSGSIILRNDGPYAALSGKAVALEPATGFTFDTPFAAMPY